MHHRKFIGVSGGVQRRSRGVLGDTIGIQRVSKDVSRIQSSSRKSQKAFLECSRGSQEDSDLRGYQVTRGVIMGIRE